MIEHILASKALSNLSHIHHFFLNYSSQKFETSIIHQFLMLKDQSISGPRGNPLLLTSVFCCTLLNRALHKCLLFHIIQSFCGNNMERTWKILDLALTLKDLKGVFCNVLCLRECHFDPPPPLLTPKLKMIKQ